MTALVAQLRVEALRLRDLAPAVRTLPARERLRALGSLHHTLAAPRARTTLLPALHAATGYPHRLLDRSLRDLFRSLDHAALERWLAAGPVRVEALDQGCAWGPELTVVVSSGNIPGAALPSVVQSLLLGSPCLVKTASGEPNFLPWYQARLLAHVPVLGEALGIAHWEGGDAEAEAAVLGEADALITYGSNTAITGLRSRSAAHARFIGYGHRISFGAVGREWLRRDRVKQVAARVALDVALFDQQGCLSPQAFYLEQGGEVSPEAFGEVLAKALQDASRVLPRRPLTAAETTAIHQYRTQMEMRSLGEEGVRLWSSPGGTAWTIALEPDPALKPCCLNRTAVLHSIQDLGALETHLRGARGLLMTASLGAPQRRRAELAPLLGAAGVTRICPLGRAQRPGDPALHDGVDALAALTRWLTVEH